MGKFNYTTSIIGHRSTSVRRAIYRRSSPKDCCDRPQYKIGRPTPSPWISNCPFRKIYSCNDFISSEDQCNMYYQNINNQSFACVDDSTTYACKVSSTPCLTPAPTDNISLDKNKPKILCLHGGGQSASSFQSNLTDLRNALPEFDFLFPQGPELGYLWFKDPPGGKENPTTDPDWALDSITYLNDYVATHGPFHSILGFSQGVGMVLLYLSHLQENNKPISFKKVILLNGYLPSVHQGITDSINRLDTYIPMLKIVGKKDDNFYKLGEELHKKLKLDDKNPNLEEIYRDEYLNHSPIKSGFSGFRYVVDFIQK